MRTITDANMISTCSGCDHLCIPVCFAGMFIRLGNLCNSEIYGDVTSLPWGFIFRPQGRDSSKHPTQLYEALSYLILGLILMGLYKYRLPKLKRGTLLGIFFIVLFGMRFLIEFIKEPSGRIRGKYGPEYGPDTQHPVHYCGYMSDCLQLEVGQASHGSAS